MVLRNWKIMTGIILFMSLLVGICAYPKMPDMMASHWNAQWRVDGYVPRFWGLFLMPFISTLLFLLFVLAPKIDPLGANIERFRVHYERFVTMMIAFLFYLYLLTILWNAGITFSIARFLSPAFGIVFYFSGVLIENAKRNWFIGIRTPWTLSSEGVWRKTHQVGGKLFKIAGAIAFMGVFFDGYRAMALVIAPMILAGVYLVVYSYSEYRKNGNKKRKGSLNS